MLTTLRIIFHNKGFLWPIFPRIKAKSQILSLHGKAQEAVTQRCSVKKVFVEISQNSQENTCARVSFLKKRLWHRCFPVNFVKFLRTSFLKEHLWWLLLKHWSQKARFLTNYTQIVSIWVLKILLLFWKYFQI